MIQTFVLVIIANLTQRSCLNPSQACKYIVELIGQLLEVGSERKGKVEEKSCV